MIFTKVCVQVKIYTSNCVNILFVEKEGFEDIYTSRNTQWCRKHTHDVASVHNYNLETRLHTSVVKHVHLDRPDTIIDAAKSNCWNYLKQGQMFSIGDGSQKAVIVSCETIVWTTILVVMLWSILLSIVLNLNISIDYYYQWRLKSMPSMTNS